MTCRICLKINHKKTNCGRAQGCKSFSSYSGCQHGHYQEQGYWRT
jgi:hypothetical protein